MKLRLLAAAAALSLVAGNAQAAEILVNGGFELPDIPGTYQTFNNGSTGITGWTVTNNSVDIVAGYNGMVAASGAQLLDLVGFGAPNGAITQTFQTVAGQAYTFSFAYSHNFGNTASASANFSITGLSTLLNGSVTHNTAGINGANLGWATYTGSFIGDGSLATLAFNNTAGGPSGGLLLDSVSVNSVPEPATWGMLILGFGMAGGMLRRRKTGTLAIA